MKASLKTLVSSKLEPEFYSLPYIFFYHKCFDPSGNIPNAVMNFYRGLNSLSWLNLNGESFIVIVDFWFSLSMDLWTIASEHHS